jgi:hypothetical protein
MTTYRLMTWMNSGSHQKSETEVMHLVKDVIQAEDFNLEDLDGFSVRKSLRMLDNPSRKGTVKFPDDWLEMDVTLEIPTRSKEDSSTSFHIPGFHYRPLVAVICSAFADIQANAFHLFPFRHIWKDPLDNHQEHVFDELYTSNSWLEAQDDLQRQPREPGCSLERVIAGLMFFSDATHLATFGTAKAWPLYLYFGNLTKYARSAPKSGACHLVGFLPSIGKLLLVLFFSLMSNFSFRITSKMSSAAYIEYRKAAWQRFMRIVGATYFKHAGDISWTRNLFMLIVMELCSGAQMEYSEGYFLVFLLALLIIQKSALFFLFSLTYQPLLQSFNSYNQRHGHLPMSTVSPTEIFVQSSGSL